MSFSDMSFSDYINGFEPADGTLHLMHSTSVRIGSKIIVAGELRTKPCDVYTGEDLLYLFYGRPAFKPLQGLPASAIAEHLPMCLVIDPALLGEAVRILPFDSGGYHRYAPLTGPQIQLSDFELGRGREVPMRLVRAFYETNHNYFHQKPTSDETAISITEGEARAFSRLSRDQAVADDDDRRSTIEVQIGRTVPLSEGLKAVVAPAVFLSDPAIVKALDKLPEVKRVTYSSYGRQQPLAYVGSLYDRVSDFLVSERVLT